MNEDEEIKQPEDTRKDFSGIIEKLKNYLLAYYEPVHEMRNADFHYTTIEIYKQLQRIVPNELIYSAADVALWLHNGGFTWDDFGEMRFEWLLKRKKDCE